MAINMLAGSLYRVLRERSRNWLSWRVELVGKGVLYRVLRERSRNWLSLHIELEGLVAINLGTGAFTGSFGRDFETG